MNFIIWNNSLRKGGLSFTSCALSLVNNKIKQKSDSVEPALSLASIGNLLKMQNKQIYGLQPQIYWVRNSVFDASNLWSTRPTEWLPYPLVWHKHKGDWGERFCFVHILWTNSRRSTCNDRRQVKYYFHSLWDD